MRRVGHSVVAFSTTAATIMSVSAADLCVRPAQAQVEDWPTRPLTLVVPFSAGGSSDTIGRIIADGISSNLRQPVVVENVAGAGGMVGGSGVAKATPDGYQFIIGNVGTFAQSQWLYKTPLYNAVTDFAPVALLTDESLVLVARNDFPADNLQQFIAYTKANQEKLHYSSSGAGGSNHLACMLLNSTIGVEVTHVPYRNVVQGLQEVMAGRMDYDCVSLPLGLPQIAGKTVKPIAILSKTRSSNLPDLPSAHEQGADKLRSPELVCTLPAREDSAADHPAAQPRHGRSAGDAVLAAAS
jgi:tripartite-type tricarboxylate transporter receptor subunit TctC